MTVEGWEDTFGWRAVRGRSLLVEMLMILFSFLVFVIFFPSPLLFIVCFVFASDMMQAFADVLFVMALDIKINKTLITESLYSTCRFNSNLTFLKKW